MQIEKKVIIASHVLNYGAPHALKEYLTGKKYDTLFIGLPFHDQHNIIVETHTDGVTEKKIYKARVFPQLFGYIADMYRVIKIVLLSNQSYDTFVGVDNLNCFIGLVLKKVGKVKRVIYYSIDFVPIRFTNPLLNNIYHQIEIFGVTHADEVWNVSPRIAEGREEHLHLKAKKYKQKVVPIGVWTARMKNSREKKRNSHQVLFIGHLLEKQGVQLAIESIPAIVRDLPNFRLLIIGDGEYMKPLKRLVKKCSVEKHVKFLGWVFDRDKLSEYMYDSAIGLAIYKPEKERLYNFSYYADPTKIKDYLSAGLPVIVTNVPYNAHEIAMKHAGIVIEYQADQLASALLFLMKNSKKLELYRANALRLAKEFDWNAIFSKTSL